MNHRKRNRRNRRRRLLSEPLESRRLLHAEGVLSGTVYFDANNDGTRDFAESGVPGVVLQLTASDAAVNRSTITDDNGNYTFGELEPGSYTVAKRAMRAGLERRRCE